MNLPADASFVAAGRDKVISWSCGGTCQLDITDLTTGTDAAVELPRTWVPPSETYPPPSASFDPSGQQLAFPLNCVDAAGTTTAENLFVADTATGTLRVVPGRPLTVASSPTTKPVQLAGSWDRQGRLWVLAMSPDNGYYQLGFWTGAGPLRTFAPAQGSPMTLSAPGSG
jgi:hypothetical protein